jgi:(2Fe-2S) ferredoxin
VGETARSGLTRRAGVRRGRRYNRRSHATARERPGACAFPMSYYQHHVFFCCNQRDPPERCCANNDALAMQQYAKQRIKALGLSGKDRMRINKAGCLDRCEEGPVIVVYPEEVWYTYVDRDDIDEIIDRHLLKGEIVERLRI